MWGMVRFELCLWLLVAKAQSTCDICAFDPLALATNKTLARQSVQLRLEAE